MSQKSREASASHPVHARRSHSRTQLSPGIPLKVLVVDDNPAELEGLVASVRLLGHECRGARDGVQAWDLHKSERADVILSDWQMPNMDGLELCRRLRASEESDGYTYFILMTCFSDKEHFVLGLEAGADDYHAKPVDIDELQARLSSARRVLSLYRRLEEQNAILRQEGQAYFRASRIDSLTQVANRLSLQEDLKVLWSRVKRYPHRYSIAICDIDRFKSYNDCFGHLAGDDVLFRVARQIRDDLREGDGLYRYGGEEFVVILPEQSLAEAETAMDRVRASVERLGIPTRGAEHPVLTMSCGVAELDRSIDGSADDWLRRADAALYLAKSSGRDCVRSDIPHPA